MISSSHSPPVKIDQDISHQPFRLARNSEALLGGHLQTLMQGKSQLPTEKGSE